jgi:uncharacterized membrane protein
MTDGQSAQTLLGVRVKRLLPLALTWVAAGIVLLALSSVSLAEPVRQLKTIVINGVECKVLSFAFSEFTIKEGEYPPGTLVTGLNAKCDGPSPKSEFYIRLDFPQSRAGQDFADFGLVTEGELIGLEYAMDPHVVGLFNSAPAGAPLAAFHGFRFDLDTKQFLDLGAFGGPAGTSAAIGVNPDGSVVVGGSSLTTAGASVYQAFRWTQALGLKNLGSIAPAGYSVAHGTSDDGTVVVGMTSVPATEPGFPNQLHAFRWVLTNPATGAGTTTDLGPATSEAMAVSSDGSVIVGHGAGTRAFRWTQAGGVVDLGVLPGHSHSMATAVSADGKVVVGISSPDFISTAFPNPGPFYDHTTARAFRWTQATGMRDLNTLLPPSGVDLTGVTLLAALSVSRDGQAISGSGIGTGDEDTSGFSVRYVDASNGGGSAATVPVVEYYNTVLDHYFITPVAVEIGLLDAKTPPFQDWSRTGFAFNGYVNATAPAGSVAICRFFNSSFAPKSSHFYAPHGLGCEATLSTFPDWQLEDDKLFNAMLPDATGACPAGTLPVYRLYNNGMGGAPNHRFVTSLAERQKMVDKGYTPEGNGIGVGMCAPQ